MFDPNSRIWFPAFAFISTLISIPLVKKFGIDNQYVTVLSSLISAILFVFLEKFVDYVMNSYRIRLLIDKTAKFEGEWLEYYNYNVIKGNCDDKDENETLYALFRIRYTGKDGEPYLVKGTAYKSDGQNIARWTSSRIKFDRTSNRIDYFYFGHFFERQYDVKGFASLDFNDSTSYTKIPWISEAEHITYKNRAHKSNIFSGTGFFVDESAGGTARTRFHFIRLTDEILKSTFNNKEKLMNFEVERKFIVEFHNKFGNSIKENGYLTLSD